MFIIAKRTSALHTLMCLQTKCRSCRGSLRLNKADVLKLTLTCRPSLQYYKTKVLHHRPGAAYALTLDHPLYHLLQACT